MKGDQEKYYQQFEKIINSKEYSELTTEDKKIVFLFIEDEHSYNEYKFSQSFVVSSSNEEIEFNDSKSLKELKDKVREHKQKPFVILLFKQIIPNYKVAASFLALFTIIGWLFVNKEINSVQQLVEVPVIKNDTIFLTKTITDTLYKTKTIVKKKNVIKDTELRPEQINTVETQLAQNSNEIEHKSIIENSFVQLDKIESYKGRSLESDSLLTSFRVTI